MSFQFFVAASFCCLLIGCDSTSNLAITRGTPSAARINATESITLATGSATPTIVFQFATSALPAMIANDPGPKLVLGGRPVALSVVPYVGWLVAIQPPQTVPPSPDLSGNTTLLFQTASGSSQLVDVHLTVQQR